MLFFTLLLVKKTSLMMNVLVLLLLPVALAASPDQRIVNGQNVNIATYPWQVSTY
jgi:secreted trypsin-like serine protease